MTDTVTTATTAAPVNNAANVPPSAPVVLAVHHKSIVESLEAELAIVEADLEASWKSHQVVSIVVLAVLATALIVLVL